MLDLLDIGHDSGSDLGRPAARGWNESTSVRLTSVCPPITILLSRPFRTSLEIACRETPRSWAASACEIQSEGTIDCSSKLVDKINLLYCTFVQYPIAREQSPIAVYPAGTHTGVRTWPHLRTRSIDKFRDY